MKSKSLLIIIFFLKSISIYGQNNPCNNYKGPGPMGTNAKVGCIAFCCHSCSYCKVCDAYQKALYERLEKEERQRQNGSSSTSSARAVSMGSIPNPAYNRTFPSTNASPSSLGTDVPHLNDQDLVFETPEYKARKAQENAAIITNGLVDALGNLQGRQESRDRFNNGLANTRDKVADVNNQESNTAQPRDNRGIMQAGQANNQSLLGEPGTESDDEDNSPPPLTAFKEPAERKIEGWFDKTIGDRIGIKGEELAERINKLEEHWGRGKKLLNGEFSPDDVEDYFPESENALVRRFQNESRDGIIGTANATIQGADFLRNSVDSDGVINWNEQEAERQIDNMNPLNHVPIISGAVALSQRAVEFYQKWGSQLSNGKVKQITKDIIGGGLIGGALALSPPLGFVFGAAWYISRKP